MEVAEHIAALRREGALLVRAAASADLDADVPRCPDWTVRDLLRHMGGVHRWANAHVAGARAKALGEDEETAIMRPPEDDAALLGWVRDGCDELAQTLESAAPDVACWSFLPAPTPLAFWARRQAHETGIHRVDAEGPSGRITPFDPAVAADGLDELLTCFAVRRRIGVALDVAERRTLLVDAPDASSAWLVAMGPEGTTASIVADARPEADCRVTGPASNLFLLLWNRADRDGVDVDGDAGLLDIWRGSVRIRWT